MKRKTKKINWRPIIIGSASVLGAAIGAKILYDHRRVSSLEDVAEGIDSLISIEGESMHATHRFVDEDIFTSLAPDIEDLVLTEGVDEGVIERVYDVAHPLCGNPENGFYNVKKYVKVLVQDMCNNE